MTAPACPRCRTPLREITYEGVHIHTCPGCGGELLTGDEMALIASARVVSFPETLLARHADHEPVVGVPTDENYHELPCPQCRTPMQLINYAHDSGVHVDRCGRCGTIWLDRGELGKIQILMERWQDEAGARIQAVRPELDAVRQQTQESLDAALKISRFAFVNALLSRVLKAA